MKIEKRFIRWMTKRFIREGMEHSFGFNIQAQVVWIRGRVAWSEREGERPFSDQEAADMLSWARTAKYPVSERLPMLVVRRLAVPDRFWPAGAVPPPVPARLVPNSDGVTWQWMIRCPYCHKTHFHGVRLASDPRKMLGHHSERCEKPIIGACGYVLIERNSGPQFIQRRLEKNAAHRRFIREISTSGEKSHETANQHR